MIVYGDGLGFVPVPEGDGLAELGENVDAFSVGYVDDLTGEGSGTVQSGGDRSIFVTLRDNDLNGFRFIDKGPGYLIAAACAESKKVALIDATGFRRLALESVSYTLSGKIRAMQASADYIFVMVENDTPFLRRLYVLENASGLDIVAQFDVDGLEQAYWVAVNEEAGVFAYPTSVGRIEIRRTVAPFGVVDSVQGIGRSAVAKWFKFPSVERNASPAVTHMLYDGDNVPDTLWTVTTGMFDQNAALAVPGDRGFTQHDNTIYLFGGTAPLSVGYREVFVPVDEVGFTLSAWLGGFGAQDDNALVEAEWRDDDDNILQTDALPTVSAADRGDLTGFLFKEIAGIIPAGATKVRVVITMTRLVGANNDGYVDGLFLTMESYEIGNPEEHYLYTLADGGAEASVSQYRVYESSAETHEDFIAFGQVHFDDAQNPVRLDDRGCSVVTKGAVTPREPITPVFRGAYQIANGFWATLWGYTNDNQFIVEQERRASGLTRNRLIGGSAEQQLLLPTLFAAGDIQEAFVVYTEGEELKWELQPQSGGGIAVTDYSLLLTEEQINTFDAFIVRQVYPGFLQYAAQDPLTVRKILSTNLGRLTLNNAGLQFDGQTQVRHTVEPNNDIPYQSAWYGRDLACRMEGGVLQAHANTGRASRILAPELGPELARGNVFSLYDFDIELSPEHKIPDADADAQEHGDIIGMSGDGLYKVLGAFEYSGADVFGGRLQFFRDDVFTTVIDPPWPVQSFMEFGKVCEINAAGTLLFATGNGDVPGIAIFNIDEDGDISYWKTITWAEFDNTVIGEKANYLRLSDDGQYLFLTNRGSSVPGVVNVLFSSDDWETFEVKQVFSRSDAAGADSFAFLDVSRDGQAIIVGAPAEDAFYIYRTDDDWDSFTEFKPTRPADIGTGINFAAYVSISSDGFRALAGTPEASVDYGSGAQAQVGAVDVYLYDNETPAYDYEARVTPPEFAVNAGIGAFASFNHAGDRLGYKSGSALSYKYYLFGLNADEMTYIGEVDDAAFFTVAFNFRWVFDSDILIVSNRDADGTLVNDIGAYKTVTFAEEP